MITLTPQELREAIAEIRARSADYEAVYLVHYADGQVVKQDDQAGYDLALLLDVVDAMAPECFDLTPAARDLLGEDHGQA